MFFDSSPDSLPKRVGLVLMTRFMNHKVFWRIKKTKSVYPVPIEIGRIKRILESCSDLLIPAQRSPKVRKVRKCITIEQAAEVPPADHDYSDDVLDFLTQPKEYYHMSPMDKFVAAFLATAAADAEGCVGQDILAKLRREHDIKKSTRALILAGWIVPWTRPGNRKVSYYTAGVEMLANSTHPKFEPEDPIQRAKFLIAQEDAMLAEKNKLESELKQVNQKLEQITTAKKLFEQLKALVEPKQ